jgi:hypothetical protein
MALYLSCALCGRKQADGLLSRGQWGHVEVESGSARQACPTCREQYRDWETRLRALDSSPASDQSSFGTSYGITA